MQKLWRHMMFLTVEEEDRRFGDEGTAVSPVPGASCINFITSSSVWMKVSHVALSSDVASFSFCNKIEKHVTQENMSVSQRYCKTCQEIIQFSFTSANYLVCNPQICPTQSCEGLVQLSLHNHITTFTDIKHKWDVNYGMNCHFHFTYTADIHWY